VGEVAGEGTGVASNELLGHYLAVTPSDATGPAARTPRCQAGEPL